MTPFTEVFERIRDTLPGTDTVRAQRAESFDRLIEIGLPSRKHEAWRYTDFAKLDAARFDWSGAPGTDTAPPDPSLLGRSFDLGGPRFVFIDGRFAPTLSRSGNARSLGLRPLQDHWAALPLGFPSQARIADHALGLLNTALTRDGLVVGVPAGSKASEPIGIVFLGAADGHLATQPRVVVDLGPNADVELVLQFIDVGSGETWTNIVTEIRLGAGARLSLVRVQEHGSRQIHTSLTAATLARDAQLELGCFELGGATVRHDIDIRLAEPGASADLYGGFLALGERQIDNQVLIDHCAAETRSRQHFRGIAGDRGRGVFSGKVVVRPDAQRIDARQRSDNLLLSKTAEIDARPALEIYADDVKCSHGATVGELDEAHLFYLRTRGIGAEAARALLTFAFANAALDRVTNAHLRSQLIERVAGRLPAHERWEHLV